MKNIFLVLLLSLGSLVAQTETTECKDLVKSVYGEEYDSLDEYTPWYSYKCALEKAKKEKKHIFVMFSRKGCEACWYMKNVILKNDDDLLEKLNKNFIMVYIEKNSKEDMDGVPKSLRYIAGPTFYFLKSDGSRVDAIYNFRKKKGVLVGAENSQDFTLSLNKALK
ncbi:MAG: DUF255 domain-containing protein [Helicobacteraceae bacterium]|nr:DUF255 domain-containing protein [Helicobacteraceae bacterium]